MAVKMSIIDYIRSYAERIHRAKVTYVTGFLPEKLIYLKVVPTEAQAQIYSRICADITKRFKGA